MAVPELYRLEEVETAANQVVEQCDAEHQTANQMATEANDAYWKAVNDMANEYDYGYNNSTEKQEALQKALKAKQEADAALEQAEKTKTEADEAAQSAKDAVDDKKNELRAARTTDTSFVVHGARLECSCAVAESSLILGLTHGVDTRGMPQIIIKDQAFEQNIMNFMGCKSKINPRVQDAAEKVVADSKAQIKANEDWRDKAMNFLFGEQEVKIDDSLFEQCVGECIAGFAAPALWEKAEEKVTINSDAPVMRKCELKCIYGGLITILFSGQPE